MSLTAAVSPLLAPLRGTSWSGSVLATGRFGAYLSVPGGAVDVVPLLGVDAIALPTAVRLGVPFPHEALPLAVGDPVRLDDDGVTVAGRRVPLVRAWTPARVRPVDRLRPFAPMAEGRAHLVAAAAAEPGSAVATLIGRGNGLTPAGDDALAGALLVACALGRHQALATAVLANTHRTTSLSAALLRAAADGYAAPPVVAYVTAVMRGDRGAAARWRPRVEAIGHGSGRDLIAGMAGLLSTIESQTALGRVS